MNVGSMIKQRRIKLGLSVDELADKLGKNRATVYRYESNEIENLPTTVLEQLASVLETTPAHLMGWEDADATQAFDDLRIGFNENLLLKKYRSLDSHGQETVSLILDREVERCSSIIREDKAEYNIISMRPVPYFQRASAGNGKLVYGEVVADPIEIPDTPEYKYVNYAIGVDGNSMEPKYFDGDVLLVEQTNVIEVGEIGIFLVDDEAYIKKLGEGELISLNKGYPNITLREAAHCMGRVVGKLEQ